MVKQEEKALVKTRTIKAAQTANNSKNSNHSTAQLKLGGICAAREIIWAPIACKIVWKI